MAMMTSRRAAIGAGLLAVPAAVTAATIVAPTAAPVDRAEWDNAMREWVAIKGPLDEAEARYHDAYAAYDEALPLEPDTRAFYPRHRLEVLNTADLDALEQEAREAGPPFVTTRLAAIAELRRYRATERTLNDHHQVDQLSDHLETLSGPFYELESRLMRMPAPDHQALLWKLEHALSTEGGSLNTYTADYMASTQADMRRLLGKEA